MVGYKRRCSQEFYLVTWFGLWSTPGTAGGHATYSLVEPVKLAINIHYITFKPPRTDIFFWNRGPRRISSLSKIGEYGHFHQTIILFTIQHSIIVCEKKYV